ncbi:MAG TPA: universal stress protein [Candidatus Angelobacter sp.]|nr:universal stress protein [Candidatus Angelobacter sp.]
MNKIEAESALLFKNILLAVDFSPASEPAVYHASAIARQCLSDVHMMHVNGDESYHLLPAEAFRVAVRDRESPPHDMLQLVKGLLDGLPNEVPLRHDGLWEVIADVVARNKIDLLILGTHGRTGLAKFIRGSVAEQIFRNVSCPVLTVGPEALCVNDKVAFKNVLLASNLDPRSAAPIYASWLCDEFKGSLTALHVTGNNDNEINTDLQKANQVKAMLPNQRTGSPRIIVEHGSPVESILEMISALCPDVVVLGARHAAQSAITSHLPWSTVSKVIAGATCPVLTVCEAV